MNQYITGSMIKELREKKKLTQLELANQLHVSDKTISKWETGKGYPDISLLEPIASVLGVSISELFMGEVINNQNTSGNIAKSQFYICPICGNVIYSLGQTMISCHGIQLLPEKAEQADENHQLSIEQIEDEYYITVNHSMTKSHYISFIAALSYDGMQLFKLYPESKAEARIKVRGVKKVYFYCNQDGLFYQNIKYKK